MPKIVIKEYDKTKAGLGNYANFSVVVPGFVKARAFENGVYKYGGKTTYTPSAASEESLLQDLGESVFDENGVYECSSRTDFMKYIGQVAAEDAAGAIGTAPTVDKVIEGTEEERRTAFESYTTKMDGTTHWVYVRETNTAESNEVGYLKDINYIYSPIESEWVEFDTEEDNEDLEEGDGTLPEDFVPGENTRTEETGEDDEADETPTGENKFVFNPALTYVVISTGNEGKNAEISTHYGNQIAYELLGLGYTVLYKRVSNTAGERVSDLGTSEYWEALKDKAAYDFRYIVTGMMDDNAKANNQIISLAHHSATSTTDSNGRGDCIALVDVDRNVYLTPNAVPSAAAIENIKLEVKNITANIKSQYAAIFAPTVNYAFPYDPNDVYKNSTFPASFHYLACAAKASENYNEWYANAGYTRGISKYTIESTGIKLGETAVQALAPRWATADLEVAVNLVIKLKNNYYLWGNRTAYGLGDPAGQDGDLKASHFLNIRQLCTTIKKQVYVACRRFTFDPNSDLLWINFCNAIRPTLEKMKADQGISDYKFVKVKTDQKAVLAAKIRIVPIEAVEDFDISIFLEDSLSGVATSMDESGE